MYISYLSTRNTNFPMLGLDDAVWIVHLDLFNLDSGDTWNTYLKIF